MRLLSLILFICIAKSSAGQTGGARTFIFEAGVERSSIYEPPYLTFASKRGEFEIGYFGKVNAALQWSLERTNNLYLDMGVALVVHKLHTVATGERGYVSSRYDLTTYHPGMSIELGFRVHDDPGLWTFISSRSSLFYIERARELEGRVSTDDDFTPLNGLFDEYSGIDLAVGMYAVIYSQEHTEICIGPTFTYSTYSAYYTGVHFVDGLVSLRFSHLW